MKRFLYLLLLVSFVFSCNKNSPPPKLDALAERYVRLVLEVGQYNNDFVDAYYGPAAWKPVTKKTEILPIEDFTSRISMLMSQSDSVDTAGFSKLEKARLLMLRKQLLAVKTKVEMMNGKKYRFDEEAALLYDAEPPHFEDSHFDSLLAQLNEALPGNGSLSMRYNEFAKQFVIPKEKLDTVFKEAIAEARERTSRYITMPDGENFKLEFVTDKSWSGYNYYQGKSQSLIQINTDFPIFIQRAVDLACHEGYPGHHVYNVLLEKKLVDSLGWKEFSVYPLFSPQSLIAEGSANYGIDVAFPGTERIIYERQVLFPLAGLNVSQADRYYMILGLMDKLSYAANEAARKYLDGEITREDCVKYLEKYSLSAPDRALQRTRFFDQYRSYTINYNLGKDIVAKYVAMRGGTADQPGKRWAVFKDLLSRPNTPSSLR